METGLKDELLKRMGALGHQLAMAGTAIWGFAVRQSIMNGIECSLGALVLLSIAITFTKLAKHYYKRNETSAYKFADPERVVLFGVFAGIFYVLMFVPLANAIDYLGNPQYWALIDLLSKVKQ